MLILSIPTFTSSGIGSTLPPADAHRKDNKPDAGERSPENPQFLTLPSSGVVHCRDYDWSVSGVSDIDTMILCSNFLVVTSINRLFHAKADCFKRAVWDTKQKH